MREEWEPSWNNTSKKLGVDAIRQCRHCALRALSGSIQTATYLGQDVGIQ